MPPKLEGDRLTYVDLDIDLLVQPDLSYQVLDLEEFEINAVRYGYSPEVREHAQEAVKELTSIIISRQFPFDFPSAVVNAS
jgi:protein associated with RNAse G/E